MIYGYVRVSTELQTVENQKYEISKSYQIDKWYEENQSGTINYKDRVLGKLIKELKPNDILVCSEISRLGRNLYMIMEILNIISQKGASVVTIKENFRLDGTISSKVVSFAFGLAAEIERSLISQRTKDALAARKASGQHIGRKPGSKNKVYKYDVHKDKIIKCLQSGMTIYATAKKLKLEQNSLRNYVKRLGDDFY